MPNRNSAKREWKPFPLLSLAGNILYLDRLMKSNV